MRGWGRRARLGTAIMALLAPVAVATTAGHEAASGATAPAATAPAVAAPATEAKAWTVMVYMVADTSNIAPFKVDALASMLGLPDLDNVNVVALVDLPDKNDTANYPKNSLPGVGPFSTAKLLVLDDNRWNEVRDLGEVPMGRPDALASFMEEAAGRFPAQHYGLVLADHGGGWQGGYQDVTAPESALTVANIHDGVLMGMQRAGIDQLDFLYHDACLMGSYEVASSLGPLAAVMVGSEEVSFAIPEAIGSEGLNALEQDADAETWAKAQVEQVASAIDQDPDLSPFTAWSVVDGPQMARVDDAIRNFVNVAIAHMGEIAPQIAAARANALAFTTGLLSAEEAESFSVVDLGDFLRNLRDVPPDVLVARDAVFEALGRAVVHQVTRQATEEATGLNVFFPSTPRGARDYLSTDAAPHDWRRFVEAYVAEARDDQGDDQTAQFASRDAEVVAIGPGGILIEGQLLPGDENHVAGVETDVYTKIDGQDVLAVSLPAYLNAGGAGRVQGTWSWQMPMLKDGQTLAPMSAIFQVQQNGFVGQMQALYKAPDGSQQDLVIRILLSSEGKVEGISVNDAGSGGAAGVELQNGGTLTPYLFTGSGTVLSSTSVTISDRTTVVYSPLDRGTPFQILVGVADLAGNFDYAFTSETVR